MSHLLQTTNEPSLRSEPIEQYESHGLLLLSGLLESSRMLRNEATPDMESARHLYHFHQCPNSYTVERFLLQPSSKRLVSATSED